MNQGLLTGEEFNKYISEIYLDEQKKYVTERLLKLTKDEQQFVVEMLKNIFPNDAKLINESKWYNTVGDIVGIFDPTGVVDLINGISYWRQGDKLFAILSWISVIPGLGDLIAKPVVGVLKAGGESAKLFKGAVVAGDAVKLGKVAESGGALGKMVETSPSWGTKLINIIKAAASKIPFFGKRFVRLLEEFVNLFVKGSKEMKVGLKTSGKVLSTAEKDIVLKELGKSGKFRGFRDYGVGKNSWLKYMKSDASLWSKISAGMPRLLGGNPAVRSLMRRTKWYLGLLSYLGIHHFEEPEELIKKNPNLQTKIDDYNQTPQSKENFMDDFGGETEGGEEIKKPETNKIKDIASKLVGDTDPVSLAISSLFR